MTNRSPRRPGVLGYRPEVAISPLSSAMTDVGGVARGGGKVCRPPTGLRVGFSHDDAGVGSRSTLGSVVSWGGFGTKVPAAVTLCLMCRPRWRRFVLFNVPEL